MTDTERMDFLSRQHWTRWVGYDKGAGWCVWPVFSHDDLRAEIDKAIAASQREVTQPGASAGETGS